MAALPPHLPDRDLALVCRWWWKARKRRGATGRAHLELASPGCAEKAARYRQARQGKTGKPHRPHLPVGLTVCSTHANPIGDQSNLSHEGVLGKVGLQAKRET